MTTRKYFGTDGIRGTVGQEPITPDFVLRLAVRPPVLDRQAMAQEIRGLLSKAALPPR